MRESTQRSRLDPCQEKDPINAAPPPPRARQGKKVTTSQTLIKLFWSFDDEEQLDTTGDTENIEELKVECCESVNVLILRPCAPGTARPDQGHLPSSAG